MSRFAVVLVLSLAAAGPALACGMYIPDGSLLAAFDAIEQAEREEARQREALLAINWVDEVGEVPPGSLPRSDRSDPATILALLGSPGPEAPARVAAFPDAPVHTPALQPAERSPVRAAAVPRAPEAASTTEQVRAFLRAVFTPPEPAAADTADTADTADPGSMP